MSRDIVSLSVLFGRWSGRDFAGLVVAGGVQDEFAEELAGVAVDDSDMQVVDEQGDRGAGAAAAQADVVQAAVVADGDGAGGVDAVGADPPVRVDDQAAGGGLGSGGVGLPGGLAADRAVRSDVVVVAAEPGELVS